MLVCVKVGVVEVSIPAAGEACGSCTGNQTSYWSKAQPHSCIFCAHKLCPQGIVIAACTPLHNPAPLALTPPAEQVLNYTIDSDTGT